MPQLKKMLVDATLIRSASQVTGRWKGRVSPRLPSVEWLFSRHQGISNLRVIDLLLLYSGLHESATSLRRAANATRECLQRRAEDSRGEIKCHPLNWMSRLGLLHRWEDQGWASLRPVGSDCFNQNLLVTTQICHQTIHVGRHGMLPAETSHALLVSHHTCPSALHRR